MPYQSIDPQAKNSGISERKEKPARITIDVKVTVEKRIVNDALIEYRLDCETNPLKWGLYSGYERIEDLALAVKDEISSHHIENPHFHIIPSEGHLPLKKKTQGSTIIHKKAR